MHCGLHYRVGVKADRIDSKPHEVFGDFRKVGWCLTTDPGMPSIAFAAFHRQADHLHDAGIAFVEVKRDDRRIAIHTESQLRQIIGSYGESVEDLAELINKQDVIRNFAHNVDLHAICAALQSAFAHALDDSRAFLNASAEWNHQLDVGETHHLAHVFHGGAFERETLRVSRMRIARGAA